MVWRGHAVPRVVELWAWPRAWREAGDLQLHSDEAGARSSLELEQSLPWLEDRSSSLTGNDRKLEDFDFCKFLGSFAVVDLFFFSTLFVLAISLLLISLKFPVSSFWSFNFVDNKSFFFAASSLSLAFSSILFSAVTREQSLVKISCISSGSISPFPSLSYNLKAQWSFSWTTTKT